MVVCLLVEYRFSFFISCLIRSLAGTVIGGQGGAQTTATTGRQAISRAAVALDADRLRQLSSNGRHAAYALEGDGLTAGGRPSSDGVGVGAEDATGSAQVPAKYGHSSVVLRGLCSNLAN